MDLPSGVFRHFPVSWRMTRKYRLPTTNEGEPYWLSWELKGWRYCRFDNDGVVNAGGVYNPVTVSQYALCMHDRLYAGDEAARAPFMAQVRYLLRTQREDGAFPYAFALPRYGLRPGWLSAMAQGEAASVFFRAYHVTGEIKYREAAARAATLLATDITNGGVSFIRENDVFFEEYPTVNPVHALNGHLFAAFALWELVRHDVTPALAALHDAAVDTLERWIERYDARGWSYYHLGAREGERHYAPLFYHQIHVAQLHIYHMMAARDVFRQIALRWRSAMDQPRWRVKVWLDGINWATTSVRRRVRKCATPAWVPIDAAD